MEDKAGMSNITEMVESLDSRAPVVGINIVGTSVAGEPHEFPLKLNMGAGLQKYEGYIGIDIDPDMPACDMEHDLMEPLDLPDECASHIFCSHTLEHLPGWRAEYTLKDWRRLLQPNGILWGHVPDCEVYAEKFLETMNGDEWGHRKATEALLGGYAWDHTVTETQAHHMAYTKETLERALNRAGFTIIKVEKENPGRHDWRLTFFALKGENPPAKMAEPTWGPMEEGVAE